MHYVKSGSSPKEMARLEGEYFRILLGLRNRQTSQLLLVEGVLILFMLCVRGWASALAGGAAGSSGTLIMIARTAMTVGTGGAAGVARAAGAAAAKGGGKK
ncbi:MAG: hypothetical protein ACRESJ_22925 [Pseudomonas sp.]|uniref:hypothetical protein n=1 Tax=Pseudomonas sp. TaxID=306 RepID=UPI003D6FC93A